MKTLDEIAISYGCDKSTPWHGYTRIYALLFEKLRCEPINLLEIGVQFGPSIRTWMDYFPAGQITGVDIYHDFKFEHPRYRFIQCNCGDLAAMDALIPRQAYDIVIDDGSHYTHDQKASFEFFWPQMKPGGIYFIEDWCVCYDDAPLWTQSRPGPQWLMSLIGDLNWNGKAYHGKSHTPLPIPDLTTNESTIDLMMLSKGLISISKKAAQ